MANPILSRARDKSVAKALQEALKAPKYHGRIPFHEVIQILKAASDGNKISDVEYRDIKRILRTQKLWGPSRRLINAWLETDYPLVGPFVYPGEVERLEDKKPYGNQQCAALVQHTIPIGQVHKWREGIRVKGNDHLIRKGTAIATFEDGFYPNRKHGNHVAYYISQDVDSIVILDQFRGEPRVGFRPVPFLGKKANGLYKDPSNNGDALSVIMKKA